jgi:hypothetical protein
VAVITFHPNGYQRRFSLMWHNRPHILFHDQWLMK